jgi:hypothetical protein
MRLFRYAVLAAVLAIPVLVAAAPATYAAVAAEHGDGSHAFALPSAVAPGSKVTFTADCSPAAGSGATLFGTTLGLPSRIPMDPESTNSFDFTITVMLPPSIAVGTYHPDIDCPGGGSTSATLHVVELPSSGGAATGDGTTSTTNNGALAGFGLALIAAGALAGGFALHRRGARPRG